MATTTGEFPRKTFSLGMLLYDKRYRSLTIQVFVLFLLMAGFAWLIDNTVTNLAALGRDFSFRFLWQTAGYDINQRLIDYNSQMTHGRAMLVGLLNTILLAVLACVLATVVGVMAGILRLSNNWIVARLMTVYVEIFRNIPTLLWILIFFAIMTEAMPPPSAFRGDDPASSMLLWDSVAVTNRGVYVPLPMLGSIEATTVLLKFALGIFGALALSRYEKKRQVETGKPPSSIVIYASVLFVPAFLAFFVLSGRAWFFSTVLTLIIPAAIAVVCFYGVRVLMDRGLALSQGLGKLLSILVAIFGVSLWHSFAHESYSMWVSGLFGSPIFNSPIPMDLPELRGFNFQGGIHLRNSLIAMWLALGIYTGAFIAEIVRAGIQSVSKGQTEAAYALGLRPGLTMRLVILPQALRVIIPPMISQYLNITKNTSLALAVGYMDLRSTLGGITINQTGRELEGMLLLMVIYLALSLTISGAMNVYNSRVKLKER